MSRRVSIPLGITLLLAPLSIASAQYYGGTGITYGTGDCNCGQPVAQTAAISPCPCAQPVQQVATACYQTVPVTEYQQVERTVQRPVVETKYVDQAYTEYVPVTEQRTVEVPTVQYQNVCECQTVTRDMGGWRTSYQRVNKVTPCEYDRRPNMLGWFNRTAYSIRQSFTPNVVAHRQYVPNVVAYNVPITRQVAIHGTKQVTYNVTNMVAQQKTRKVAVNTVRYVAEKQTVSVPRTVYRTVPIGTATAFLPLGTNASATALAPTPDTIGQRNDESRTAEDDGRFRREESTDTSMIDRRGTTPAAIRSRRPVTPEAPAFPQAQRPRVRPAPEAVVATNAGWVSRSKNTASTEPAPTRTTAQPTSGPALIGPSVASSR